MNLNYKLTVSLIFASVLLFSSLTVLGAAPQQASMGSANILYVDDDTCPQVGTGTQLDPYCKIQTAIDNSISGDEIRVAEGVYTGVATVTAANSRDYTQVVFIDKSLTLQGGFDAGNWSAPPDPLQQKSIIDAQRSGRGISAVGTGTETVTIDGFTITGGDYSGLGNPPGPITVCRRTEYDCGGGLYAYYLEMDLLNSYVFDNFASTPDSGRNSDGGGVYYYDTRYGSSIQNTIVISNTVSGPNGEGGGMKFEEGSDITIENCVFENNTASDQGGGLVIDDPVLTATVSGTNFYHNQAYNYGGAVKATVSATGTALRMERIRMVDNQGYIEGTAMFLRRVGSDGVSEAELTNIVFAGNQSRIDNAAANVLKILQWGPFQVTLNHVTAADNLAETFLNAQTDDDEGDTLDVILNNTLLQSFTNGYAGREVPNGELTITHNNTLFENVTNQEVIVQGTPTFIPSGAFTGFAMLDSSYHLTASSDAIAAGVAAGVTDDIDGDPRPVEHPDIGADQYLPRVYAPFLLKASP